MVLKDAIIDMRPCPCGAVVVAAHLGLRVSRVVADGFLARGRPIWGGIDAADLDAAFRRFGRRLSFVGGCRSSAPRHAWSGPWTRARTSPKLIPADARTAEERRAHEQIEPR